jgi:phosphoglucosamine mutase
MGRQLFGTDGIRGVAGRYPLDVDTVFAFGRALGEWALGHSANPRVLIGRDTRESGPGLAELVGKGLRSAGAEVDMVGELTTPGVAWLTKTGPYAAGVMISASHNPFEDNGLKVFAHSGYKLPDSEEAALETRLFELKGATVPPGNGLMRGLDPREYLEFLAATCSERLTGMKIVVDCANGAACRYAGPLLRELGASVVELHCTPNGRNINLGCGALHLEELQRAVLDHGAELGVAFDGDADRAIFASGSGMRVDGDHILLLCGGDAKDRGALPGDLLVATVMSNLGLEWALRRRGIALVRTAVGDKYVLEEMIRQGAALGGEQSGHVIFHEHATTGDGMLTALRVLDVLRRRQASLDEMAA